MNSLLSPPVQAVALLFSALIGSLPGPSPLRAADSPAMPAAIHAGLMRYADVSATQIVFVYGGDIWLAPKSGGVAVKLSSPPGEEMFPKFSPDGTQIAFSANYDGNTDIYIVPVTGGLPRRLTHHGAADRVIEWYPDGRSLLYATMMTSYKDRFNQLYRIPVTGGLPEKLPVPYGEFAALSPDAKILAYTPISVDFRTWKRYRGGMNPDIWLFDLEKNTARNLTRHDANDSLPMWRGDTLYFLSNRDAHGRDNLWAYDTRKERFRQLTAFQDYDVKFPSIGPADIVFECGGKLYLLDLATEKYQEVKIQVVTDQSTLKPRLENVSGYIHNAAVSPSGKRVIFEARGDVFSAPAENGVVRNLTRTSGVAERYPAWSPDGRWLAYFSDRTGEYELTLRPADGTGEEQTLTSLGPGYRYRPQWSPDSQKIVWIDQAMKIWLYDFAQKQTRMIDRQKWRYHGALHAFTVSWSPDSRWLAYDADKDNRQSCIVLYDTDKQQRHEVTSGFYDDREPVFDPDGKYLYLRTGRQFAPMYSELDNSWVYANTWRLAAVPLRRDVPSPLAPRNDEEPVKKEDAKEEPAKTDTAKTPEKSGDKPAEKPAPAATDKKPKPVTIDLEGFEERMVLLPPKAGRYADLCATSGKLIYRVLPRTGSDATASPAEFYDLEKRDTKRILDDADDLQLSANREKLLVRKDRTYAIIEPKENQNLNKKVDTSGFEALIDPPAEWRQIFMDAWRIERDYFYDPNLHGVDWQAMRERYGKMLNDCVTRWDVNYLIGELIAELNASHTYRSGGDVQRTPERGVGYLGCDFSFENGAYRIKKIIRAAPWDTEVTSPLLRPGLTNVQEGDYLLAVNGQPLDPAQDPWAAFQGLADKPVLLTVNDRPELKGAREVLVHTLASEARLRHLAWINENRLKVERLSQGRIGYVYVPDTGVHGQTELVRQFRAQITKDALIIDERFNSGGQIPDRFIELLSRKRENYWGVRDGLDWPWPPVSHTGPKAMLINGWSGSGGDCFPYYFKQAGLGPLIGMRTWGGLIGMTGTPALVDNGSVTAPTFGIYNLKGEWIIEGYGVDPDIEVVDDPARMAQGGDPQLERAVDELLKALKKNPPTPVKRPKYPNRAGKS
ncbi:PDZ domain-containing protein [Fontisphaera persica]|uniref:S41 family peptidase n=1 Tax=Fontisphaera persica TaxID=2974023 RepID=UPI0024C01C61|nr:S41 family peptidase [Fontisphaera persica]WCJ59263.1 PDZ domain-containing protein [Fontisphaera persica]